MKERGELAYENSHGPNRPNIPWKELRQRERGEWAALERAVRNAALEEAAKVAADAYLVPPDGGSPTNGEYETARRAAERIRSLIEKEPK